VQQRPAVKAFEGFHRAVVPRRSPNEPARLDVECARRRSRRAAPRHAREGRRAASLEQRAAETSARARPVFDKRGQLLPRDRIALLLDPGAPWLPLATLAGWLQDTPDAERSVPGGGIVAGIGIVAGVRCMIVAATRASTRAPSRRWARQDPARAAHRAREQAAVRAPGRKRRRQPDALSRRGLRARRRAVPQPGAAVGGGHPGAHGAARARARPGGAYMPGLSTS
jgi:hypothetical protein